MANPAPVEPEAPRPWYAGLIGFVVVVVLLGAVGLSTAASYSSDDGHSDEDAEHSEEEGDHSEDE